MPPALSSSSRRQARCFQLECRCQHIFYQSDAVESRGITPARTFILLPLQCGFDAPLTQAIAKAGYERPTAIQAQALPAALSGRDVLVSEGGERGCRESW